MASASKPLTWSDNSVDVQFTPGDVVQTPFGKGVVREVRNGGRLAVDVGGRALIVKATAVAAITEPQRVRRARKGAAPDARNSSRPGSRGRAEVDLHGLTVEEALARSERALNDALLQDVQELRLIHGRSGGRIRAALHTWLREMPAVRHVRLDARNEGVTIVEL